MSLQGKTAVVTGAASGIGRECARHIARDGAAFAIWDLDGAGAAETVRLIEADGGRAQAFVGDASDRATIARILEQVRAELGPVLILVNNAGITGFKPFL